MCRLILPNEHYAKSYLEACEEMKRQGLSAFGIADTDEKFYWRKFLDNHINYRNGENLPPGAIQCTTYWLVDNGEFIGSGNVRHFLTPQQERLGGHIGYIIRPGQWNKGYGTILMKALLGEAAKKNIKTALVTCDHKNTASARVIEKNGGSLLDTVTRYDGGTWTKTKRYLAETGLEIKNYTIPAFRPKIHVIENIYGKDLDLCLEGLYGKDIHGIVNYVFDMRDKSTHHKIGRISLRLGSDEFTYYAGNIGYNVEKSHRGNHYAAKATLMLRDLLREHTVKDRVFLTVNPDNLPSRKTCEYIGCKYLELVKLPIDNEMYRIGERQKCRYYFEI